MISAGESSGELYGALLSRELRRLWPGVEIFGIGGNRMKDEGVLLIAPISHVLGIAEAFTRLFEIRNTFKKAKEALISRRPDILVLIDYPDFNIALAKRARKAGIPVLYYVSPQVWAWRSGRVKKIAALVNRMAVLFPFEVAYYRDAGLSCEFVGHPIAETMARTHAKENLKQGLGLDTEKKVIALLPGSRPNEISRHQEIIRGVAEKIHGEFPDIQIVIPLASGTAMTAQMPDYANIIYDNTPSALACAEAAAIASGTATFEAALAGTPMVVFYRISPVTFFLGRALAKVKFISLVNILSERELVRELLQEEASAENIFHEIRKILQNASYRDSIISGLSRISDLMKNKRPSERVASIIGEMTG